MSKCQLNAIIATKIKVAKAKSREKQLHALSLRKSLRDKAKSSVRVYVHYSTLGKHAYSNILKISPPQKTESFKQYLF